MLKIAFIGTGVMGAPMARHLAKAGYQVTVFNRTIEKAKALADVCQVANTLSDAVKSADFVFSIVGMVEDVKNIYLSDQGIINSAKKGAILCDMTTSSATLAKEIYQKAKAKDLFALDAPVTGGDKGAREATLSIMVGGDEYIFDACLPFLQAMGKTVTYMGPAGNGQLTKFANQMSIAGCLAGISQALAFGQRQGLDSQKVLDVINNGSAASWQAINNGPKMLSHDYAPGFYIKHLMKDLGLGLEEENADYLPLSQLVLNQLQALADQGKENLGTQALYEFYKKSE